MREIKFRGKAIMSIEELELMGIEHDSGWVYGNLIKNGNRPMITADILEEIEESIYPEWWVVVEPKSVGQYTGLKDKNGREIYEGDIVINTGLWYLPSTVKIQHVKERYGEGEIFVVNFNITGVELRHKDNWVMDKEKRFLPNGFIGRPYVDNHDAWNYQKSLEVIGNIFQDGDLLRDS